jgi:integrating conjugative element protein (TIGR03761 family)
MAKANTSLKKQATVTDEKSDNMKKGNEEKVVKKETKKEAKKENTPNMNLSPNNKKPFKIERPGRLKSEVQLALHTVDAQTAFAGYSAKDAVSLLRFGGRMTEVWDAAAKDDPYADWMLLKVYDGLIKLRNQLAALIQDYQYQLNQSCQYSSLTLTPFLSEKPLLKPLWFRTQYGYLGANLIADFDELIRTVLTANRVGVILDKSHEVIRDEWLKQINELFKLPFKWQPFNVTRADMKENNELAAKAKKGLGKLPNNILMKTLRSPFSPHIREVAQSNNDKNKNEEEEVNPS